MADSDTDTFLDVLSGTTPTLRLRRTPDPPPDPPVSDTPAPDTTLPAVTPPAPTAPKEKSLAEQAQEEALKRARIADEQAQYNLESQKKRDDEAAASRARERELKDREAAIKEEGARDILEESRRNREWREQHPRPQPPSLQNLPPRPQRNLQLPPGLFGPMGDTKAPGNRWFNAMSVFGSIASGRNSQQSILALNFMTGMLEGWAKGNAQKFQDDLGAWKDQMGLIEKTYNEQTKYYDAILNDNKLSISEKAQELQLAAMPYEDKIIHEQALRGDLEAISKTNDERLKQLNEAVKTAEQIVKVSGGGAGGLTEEAIHQFAINYLDNGVAPPSRGAATNAAVMNEIAKIGAQRGMTDEQIGQRLRQSGLSFAGARAGAQVLGRQTTTLENLERRLIQLIPDALAASDAVARTKWVVVNEAIQAWQAGSSDPRIEAFATTNLNLAEIWARSQKPTGVLDVALQNRALARLNTAKSNEVYRTIVNQIVREIYRNVEAAKSQQSDTPIEIPSIPGAYVPPGQQPLPGQAPSTYVAPGAPAPIGDYEQWKRQFQTPR
jgi:hypothetical protein